MSKYILWGVGLLLLVVGGVAYSVLSPNTSTETEVTTSTTPTRSLIETVTEAVSPAQEGGPEINAVSVPTLFDQSFDGRDFTVGRVLAENESYTRHYITYKSGELTISGVMNVPKGEGPFPVLFLNHGYIDPAIYTNGRGLKREQDYLARRGYVVIHSDYRNHADSTKDPNTDVQFRLGYVEDVINAVQAVRAAELPYIDSEKVGMLGHSMGGGVTQTILVAQPDLIDAAVLFAPVSTDARDNYDRWITRRPETAQKIRELYGTPEENPEFWDNVSVRTFLDRIRTPILLTHGTADDSVPIEWSDRTNQDLKQLGKDIIYDVYPGEPHEFAVVWGQVMQRTVTFFDQHLKG